MCGSSQYSCSRMKASRAVPRLSITAHRIVLDPHLLRYGWTPRCSSARNGEARSWSSSS
jgi:hypothetical protein